MKQEDEDKEKAPTESEVLKGETDPEEDDSDADEVDDDADTEPTKSEDFEDVASDESVEEEKEPEDKSEDQEEESKFSEFGPIKRPASSDADPIAPEPEQYGPTRESSLNWGQPLRTNRSSNKKTIILVVILILVLAGGFLLLRGTNIVKNLGFSPTPSPSLSPTSAPTEVPKFVLTKSEWVLEVLNGSGETGLAKKIADQIKEQGYEVVKVGNAQNQDFEKTEILVKPDLTDKVELLIADLKDIVKVASYGGELNEGTASARIILGKDIL